MSKLGDDLNQSLKEAVAHAKGEGPSREHAPANPRDSNSGEPTQPPTLKNRENLLTSKL